MGKNENESHGAALTEITEARKALARAQDIYSVLEIRDVAKAGAIYAEARDAGEAANEAKEVQLRAERKAGSFLKGLERGKGGNPNLFQPETSSYQETMEEVGISRPTAHRWQKIADVPDDDFERFVAETRERGKELTQSGALKLARKLNRPQPTVPPDLPEGKYHVIYADPPWRYEHVKTESRAVENQYPTMSLKKICGLPIADIAADDSVIFLWTTSPKVEESLQVLNAWGFTYRTCLVWVKDRIGMGYYARQRHELLLVGRRGEISPPEPSDRFDSVIEAPRLEHSQKPNVVYEMLETMYPDHKRVELFARQQRPGWEAWGNEL